MAKLKILVFGNTLLKNDRLPITMMEELQKEFPDIEFREFDTVEDIHKEGRSLYIVDTVEGIEHVITITRIDQLITNKIYSVHDFDLAYNLKLLKKADMIENVMIFGIPMAMKKGQALRELKKIIRSTLLLEND
jgi:Ni,Fe-hydrogenase maturation factor